MAYSQTDVTQLLDALRRDDPTAADRLFPLIYDKLRVLAHRRLQHERTDHTLGTTALVHEVFLRLVGRPAGDFQDSAHFMAVAARAMRCVLVDFARARKAGKRGGEFLQIPLADIFPGSPDRDSDLIALNEVLARLAAESPVHARVVEMRFFAEMQTPQIAAALQVDERTVRRYWEFARTWLFQALDGGPAPGVAEGDPDATRTR